MTLALSRFPTNRLLPSSQQRESNRPTSLTVALGNCFHDGEFKHVTGMAILSVPNEEHYVISSASSNLRDAGVYIASTTEVAQSKLSKIPTNIPIRRVWDLDVRNENLCLVADQGQLLLGSISHNESLGFNGILNKFKSGYSGISFARIKPGSELQLRVACSTDQQLLIRDGVNGSTQIIRNWYEGNENVHDLAWSPSCPSLLATAVGGMGGSRISGMEIYDDRMGRQSPSITINHDVRFGSKIAWNPFVPYWIAASDRDQIAIYDLRYASGLPASILPCATPSAFAWSKSNCELMMVSSAGRTVSPWSIRDQRRLASINHSNSVVSSDDCGLSFYAMSLMGKIGTISIDSEFFKSNIPHQYALFPLLLAEHPLIIIRHEKGSIEYEIEGELYCRNFDKVYSNLISYSNSTTSGDYKRLLELTKKAMPRDEIEKYEWEIGQFDKAAEPEGEFNQFKKEMKELVHSCPPGYKIGGRSSEQDGKNIAKVMKAIEEIGLKANILEIIEAGDIDRLKGIIPKIELNIGENNNFLSPTQVGRVVALLFSDNRVAAMNFGKTILSMELERNIAARLDVTHASILHVLLYPTIYDEGASMVVQYTASPSSPASNRESPMKASKTFGLKILDDNSSFSLGPPPVPGTQSNIGSTMSISNETALPSGRSPPQTISPKYATMPSPVPLSYVEPSPEIINNIRKTVRSVRSAINMVDLEIDLEACKSREEEAQLLWREMKDANRTVSMNLIWFFLQQVLEKTQMDIYFAFMGRICRDPAIPLSLSKVMLGHMDMMVMPRFKYILSQALETHRPSLVLKALLLVALLVDGIRPLPIALSNYLSEKMTKLVHIIEEEDYSKLKGYQAFVSFLQQLSIPFGLKDGSDEVIWTEFARLQSIFIVPQ